MARDFGSYLEPGELTPGTREALVQYARRHSHFGHDHSSPWAYQAPLDATLEFELALSEAHRAIRHSAKRRAPG